MVATCALLATALTVAGCAVTGDAAGAAQASAPVELRVSAASSLRHVLDAAGPAFEKANGVTLVVNYGASGQLQKQIEAGAPVDVFLSASPRQVDALSGAGLVSAEETATFAGNDLAVVVKAGAPSSASGLGSLLEAERLVTGNPETAPFGTKAKEWLGRRGVWRDLEPKFVFAEHAAQAIDYVARGEVDAGVVFRSEATTNEAVRVTYVVPADEVGSIHYVAAPVSATKERRAAEQFLAFLESETFQDALADAGFNRAPGR